MKRLIPLLLCAACAAPETPSAPQDDTCGRTAYTHLIGQDATALERELIMGKVRVVRPDDMVTMDFNPERINFKIDRNEKIADITCG